MDKPAPQRISIKATNAHATVVRIPYTPKPLPLAPGTADSCKSYEQYRAPILYFTGKIVNECLWIASAYRGKLLFSPLPPRLDSCVYALSCCRSPVFYEGHETNLTLKRQLTLTNLSRGIRPSLSMKPTHRPVPSQTAIATASAGPKRRRATPPTSLQPLPLNKILQSQQESHNPLVMAAIVSLYTKEHCYSGAFIILAP